MEGDETLQDECASGDSDEWDEMEINGEQTTCLFCPLQFLTIAVALDHCRAEHNFDLLELKHKHNMDCYSYIKLINYVRLHKPEPKVLTESSVALWNDDIYLKTGDMESWLMYDFDDLGSAPSTPHYAIDGKTPISTLNFADMQRQINDLTLQLKQKDVVLDKALAMVDEMKSIARTLVEDVKSSTKPSVPPDSDYFGSYSTFGIHHQMLDDKVRTGTYKDAVLNNPITFKDKIVLDLGCGTGILSMFAAKAGASKVYGIDQAEIVYQAMDIIRENNYFEKIHVMKGKVEETNLPVEKVDIIISEWMGYFLLYEAMLDSLIYARDQFLKPDGVLLPNRCNISLVGSSDTDFYDNLVNFWDDVYGFSMKCMKTEVLNEVHLNIVPESTLLTNPVILTEIDMKTCTTSSFNFSSKFSLNVLKPGLLTSLVGYFDTFFDLPNTTSFSTGPNSPPTHWKQAVFFLNDPIKMEIGDVVEGCFTCTRHEKDARGLAITITLGNKKLRYRLS